MFGVRINGSKISYDNECPTEQNFGSERDLLRVF